MAGRIVMSDDERDVWKAAYAAAISHAVATYTQKDEEALEADAAEHCAGMMTMARTTANLAVKLLRDHPDGIPETIER